MTTRNRLYLALLLALVTFGGASSAQELLFKLHPSQSNVAFTLGDVLHTVHGTFRMKDSVVRFNPANGNANGSLVLDAQSGDSGSKARDRKMHKDILESSKYPEIRFNVQSVRGTLLTDGKSELQLSGTMTLHGTEHSITVVAPVEVHGGVATADVHFRVPYVAWGLKNPSTFILRVSDKVNIDVHAVGTLTPVSH